MIKNKFDKLRSEADLYFLAAEAICKGNVRWHERDDWKVGTFGTVVYAGVIVIDGGRFEIFFLEEWAKRKLKEMQDDTSSKAAALRDIIFNKLKFQ